MSNPFELNIHAGKPYWMVDILWVVLAEQNTTASSHSLIWQLCPQGSGPGPHHHDQDEGFYVLDGQITYQAGEQTLVATTGSFVWIPCSTVHSFKVDSPRPPCLTPTPRPASSRSSSRPAFPPPASSCPSPAWA